MFGLEISHLIFPTFIAGVLTFLAPCTLPLLPAYLGFIGGVSLNELEQITDHGLLRRQVIKNGLWYVIGFSAVFILLGALFGLGGGYLVQYRIILARLGGIVVIFFGLWMMGLLKLKIFKFVASAHRFNILQKLKPGQPLSSFIFGVTFAFGWSPCVGPILGTVLLLASTGATVGSGALLLTIFSIGLAIPFLLIAWFFGRFSKYLSKISQYYRLISIIGGWLLVLLGWALMTDGFFAWIGFFYKIFNFANYQILYNYF